MGSGPTTSLVEGKDRNAAMRARTFGLIGVAAVAAAVPIGLLANHTGSPASTATPPTTTYPCPPAPLPGQTSTSCGAAGLSAAQAQAAKQWPVSASSYLTRDAVVAEAARTHVVGTAHALQTTYSNAAALLGESPNPAVDPATEVWVVTLTAPQGQHYTFDVAPGAPPQTPTTYSAIYDAANGGTIDDCTGCKPAVTSG